MRTSGHGCWMAVSPDPLCCRGLGWAWVHSGDGACVSAHKSWTDGFGVPSGCSLGLCVWHSPGPRRRRPCGMAILWPLPVRACTLCFRLLVVALLHLIHLSAGCWQIRLIWSSQLGLAFLSRGGCFSGCSHTPCFLVTCFLSQLGACLCNC